jgi:hypothetical protein
MQRGQATPEPVRTLRLGTLGRLGLLLSVALAVGESPRQVWPRGEFLELAGAVGEQLCDIQLGRARGGGMLSRLGAGLVGKGPGASCSADARSRRTSASARSASCLSTSRAS